MRAWARANAMLDAIWQVLQELAPWLLLGMAIAGILHGVLPTGFIHRQLSGKAGVLKAVALGVPLPLCSCGVIPAGLGLKRDGASDGASVRSHSQAEVRAGRPKTSRKLRGTFSSGRSIARVPFGNDPDPPENMVGTSST